MVLTSQMIHDVHETRGGWAGTIDDSSVYRPQVFPY